MRQTKKPVRKSTAKDAMMKQLMARITKKDAPPMTLAEKAKEQVIQKSEQRLLEKNAHRSETYKKFLKNQIEKAAEAREKERVKKAQMVIKPRVFHGPNGGRLTANGKIYDNSFKEILRIDKNGNITNKMGMKLGKYNPYSHSSMYKLERLVEKYCEKEKNKGRFWGNNNNNNNGGFWG